MKTILATAALAGLALFAARAADGGIRSVEPRPIATQQAQPIAWSEFGRSLGARESRLLQTAEISEPAAAPDLDVVDAHWMAMTMWGEARGDGEPGMRAVGHVIDNRRRLGRHGAFVTDTVSEAWQFSCWNPGDPNLAAMMNVDALPATSREGRMWLAAKRVAEDILSGRSEDPTGGAIFYHTIDVAPRWSQGLTPVERIGRHLFFRSAR